MADRRERHVRAHTVGESKFLEAESRVDRKVNGLVRPLKQQHLTGCIEEERGKKNKDDPSEGSVALKKEPGNEMEK